jgi:hypothetical protein
MLLNNLVIRFQYYGSYFFFTHPLFIISLRASLGTKFRNGSLCNEGSTAVLADLFDTDV